MDNFYPLDKDEKQNVYLFLIVSWGCFTSNTAWHFVERVYFSAKTFLTYKKFSFSIDCPNGAMLKLKLASHGLIGGEYGVTWIL